MPLVPSVLMFGMLTPVPEKAPVALTDILARPILERQIATFSAFQHTIWDLVKQSHSVEESKKLYIDQCNEIINCINKMGIADCYINLLKPFANQLIEDSRVSDNSAEFVKIAWKFKARLLKAKFTDPCSDNAFYKYNSSIKSNPTFYLLEKPIQFLELTNNSKNY